MEIISNVHLFYFICVKIVIALPYIFIVIYFFSTHCLFKYGAVNRRAEPFFLYFVLGIFFCFRGYIFTDFVSYVPFFENAVPKLPQLFATNYLAYAWWEPGFVLYCSTIKTFTDNYFLFQAIDSTIDLILLYHCLKYFNSNKGLNIIVFLAMSGMIAFIDNLRNIKSILLFFYSLRFIENRKFVRFCFCCCIGLSFHKSALIYFLCYPFFLCKLSKKIFMLLGMIGVISIFFSRPLLFNVYQSIGQVLPAAIQQKVEFYMLSGNLYSISRVITLGTIEKLFVFLLIVLNYNKLYREDKKNYLLINCYLAYFLSYFIFFGFTEVSNRISLLFIFSYWCIIPKIVSIQNKKYQSLYLILILAYCILKISLYSQPVQAYENWLWNIRSFEQRVQIMKQTFHN